MTRKTKTKAGSGKVKTAKKKVVAKKPVKRTSRKAKSISATGKARLKKSIRSIKAGVKALEKAVA